MRSAFEAEVRGYGAEPCGALHHKPSQTILLDSSVDAALETPSQPARSARAMEAPSSPRPANVVARLASLQPSFDASHDGALHLHTYATHPPSAYERRKSNALP